jgi:hypothetical protein
MEAAIVQVGQALNSVEITPSVNVIDISPAAPAVVEISGVTIIRESTSATFLLRLETAMQAGVLTYVLPSLPPENALQVFINGVQVSAVVDGVNLTITGYSAGEIENDDELKVYY